jgi:hypothetical protein
MTKSRRHFEIDLAFLRLMSYVLLDAMHTAPAVSAGTVHAEWQTRYTLYTLKWYTQMQNLQMQRTQMRCGRVPWSGRPC